MKAGRREPRIAHILDSFTLIAAVKRDKQRIGAWTRLAALAKPNGTGRRIG